MNAAGRGWWSGRPRKEEGAVARAFSVWVPLETAATYDLLRTLVLGLLHVKDLQWFVAAAGIGILDRKPGCVRPEGGSGPKGRVCLSRRPVAVAEAAYGLDRGGSGCVRGELPPQVADVELHLVA